MTTDGDTAAISGYIDAAQSSRVAACRRMMKASPTESNDIRPEFGAL